MDTSDSVAARNRRARIRGWNKPTKAWLAPLKKGEPEVIVRFETPPGKQMQADFTWVRRGRDLLMALVATLGYSRATFVKFGQKEDVTALREGLREALDYFGGVPEQILFDNAKTVVIDRDAHGVGLHRWNDRLLELAEDCGFTPRLCRPYRAKKKVERFNGYLKGSFLVPLAARLHATGLNLTAEVANAHVRRWLDEVANARVHATTKASGTSSGGRACGDATGAGAEGDCGDAAAGTSPSRKLTASAVGI